MSPCTLCLAALVAVALILIATAAKGKERFLDPAKNIGVYDQPYWHYPVYEGRQVLKWDSDNRCTANCQQSPCVVWCR